MEKRGIRTMLQRTSVVLVIAVTVVAGAVACTGDSDDEDGPSAALEICEDFTFVPCPRQVATLRLPLTGSSFSLVYTSDRVSGRKTAAVLPSQDLGLAGWSLDVLHSYDADGHVLVMGDGTRRHVDAVSMESGRSGVGSVDGAQVYVFDNEGRQQLTIDALTGTRLLTFLWGKDGVASITEPGNRKTVVERDSHGDMVAIVSDRGYRTRFGVLDGWLAAAADETGNLTRVTTGKTGLVTALRPAEGDSTKFEYDDDGRLVKIDGPGSRSLELERRNIDGGFEVVLTTAAKRTEKVRVQKKGDDVVRTFTDARGIETTVVVSTGHRSVAAGDGSKLQLDLSDDPVWGTSAPVIANGKFTTAAGRKQTVHERRASEPSEPGVAPAEITRSFEVDGAAWTTSFDPAARQIRVLDPSGLSQMTTLDGEGRPVRVEADGAPPQAFEYSPLGVIKTMSVGSGAEARVWRYGYDRAKGSVSVTDPTGIVTALTDDANGLAKELSAPGVGTISLERDSLGRVVGITPPSGATSGTSYGSAGDIALTTRPEGEAGPMFTVFERDADGELRAVGHSAGDNVSVNRDAAGRPTQIGAGADEWALTYSADDERVEGAGVALERDVDAGSVLTERWSGPFDVRVDRTVDGSGRLTSVAVDQGAAAAYQYDEAGRVRRAGELDVTRDPGTGRVTEEHVGALVRRWQYNAFGEIAAITVDVGGQTVQSLQIERDGLGRVVGRAETDGGGASRTSRYTYDEAGRVSTVVEDGVTTAYSYDLNGNLVDETRDGDSVTSTFAADDALVRRGDASYGYDSAGRLESVTDPQGETRYHYDSLGNLLSAADPSGAKTTYVVDGVGRRITRAGGSGPARGFVYLDGTRPAAMLDGNGQVLSSFVYSAAVPTPAYVRQGDRTLFVVTDDIGTPRALVDVQDGSTVWQLRTDVFGRVQSDTDFAQFPFSFAGGLADPGTDLVRFGARDYDPDTGRWTAPDPVGYAGGDANLYRYVGGDPVNRVDPSGLMWPCDVESIAIQVGAGTPIGGVGGKYGLVESDGKIYQFETLSVGPTVTPAAGIGFEHGCAFDFGGGKESSLDRFAGKGYGFDIGYKDFNIGGDWSYGADGKLSQAGWHYGWGKSKSRGKQEGTGTLEGTTLGRGLDLRGFRWLPPSETHPSRPRSPKTNMCSSHPAACLALELTGGPSALRWVGGSHDEPHLRTLDGVSFDFQGAGEYTALRSDSGDLVVQTRQQIQNGVRSVTWNMAVAVGVGKDRVTFARNETGWDVRLNGARIVPTAATELPGGGRLLPDGTGYSVVWADGSTVRVMLSYLRALNVQVAPAPGRIGTLHGLLGPFTGTTTASTIEAADGTQLDAGARADRDQLYGVFGDSWRITQRESRFDYRAGESTDTFTDRSIPDANPVRPSAMAKAVCRAAGLTGTDLGDCALDVTITGDASLALRARAALTAPPSNADRPVVPAVKPTVFHIGVGDTVAKDQPAAGAGEIAKAGELDAYEIEGKAGTALLIRAAADCDEGSDLGWQINGPPGSQVSGAKPICFDLGRIDLDKTGTYTVTVGIGAGGAVGTYGFSVTSASSGGGNLAPGDTVSDRIADRGGKRVYELHMDKGDVVYLRSLDGSCDLVWGIFGPPAGGVANAKPMCSDMGRIHAGATGTYTITIGGQATSIGSFGFEVVPSNPDTVRTVSVGDTASGSISAPGALAIYKLHLDEGATVYLRTGDTSCATKLNWTVGGPPASNVANAKPMCSDIGDVLAGVDGTYLITVGGQEDAVGDYTFTVERK